MTGSQLSLVVIRRNLPSSVTSALNIHFGNSGVLNTSVSSFKGLAGEKRADWLEPKVHENDSKKVDAYDEVR